MKKRSVLIRRPLLVLVPVCSILIAAFSIMASRRSAHTQPNPTGFALVELYTSEGCSSCPPADEALARIAETYRTHVYVLAFHVDYWDRLGWKDIYSNPEYTHRQQEYARILHLSSIYTPQAVINGETELVGSQEKQLRSIIDADLKRAGDRAIELSATCDGHSIQARYTLPDADAQTLYIALVQRHAESQVRAGENGGRLLKHINIVRALKSIELNNSKTGSLNFALPHDLSSKDSKLIAWLQKRDDKSAHITGATETDIP